VRSEMSKEVKVGEVFETHTCGSLEVIEQLPKRKFKVRFVNTGFERVTDKYCILKGAVGDSSIVVTGVKISQENFIAECKEYFPDYDYSTTVYINRKQPVEIGCPMHGKFIRSASHRYGRGLECPTCMKIRISSAQKTPVEEFIKKAREIHGSKFDYSKVKYVTARVKVEIICPIHGSFWQAPYTHLSCKGCKKCSNAKLFDERKADISHFLKKAREKHGDTYDYCLVKYVNARTRVDIVCKTHGVFSALPYVHWDTGGHCPDCVEGMSGFNNSQSGYFYIISDGDITKVGISNSKVDNRLNNVKRSSGINFKPIKSYFIEDGDSVRQLEREIIKFMRSLYIQPTFKFDGYTECFYGVDLCLLLNQVENKIRELNEESQRKA
jgi:hypothetical protein